jgi:hypothetical protein
MTTELSTKQISAADTSESFHIVGTANGDIYIFKEDHLSVTIKLDNESITAIKIAKSQ